MYVQSTITVELTYMCMWEIFQTSASWHICQQADIYVVQLCGMSVSWISLTISTSYSSPVLRSTNSLRPVGVCIFVYTCVYIYIYSYVHTDKIQVCGVSTWWITDHETFFWITDCKSSMNYSSEVLDEALIMTTGWPRPIECLVSCRIFSAKEPLIIGLLCGKWPIKIRHPLRLRHSLLMMSTWWITHQDCLLNYWSEVLCELLSVITWWITHHDYTYWWWVLDELLMMNTWWITDHEFFLNYP